MPDFNLALNVSKATAYWPSTDSFVPQNLRASVPINVAQEEGLVILGACRLDRVHGLHPHR